MLHELKGRFASLSSSAHQRLLLGLLGDPTRAKVAKESSALLKAIQREEPSQVSRSSSRQLSRQRPYAPSHVFASDAACLVTLRGLVIVEEVVGIISVKQ